MGEHSGFAGYRQQSVICPDNGQVSDADSDFNFEGDGSNDNGIVTYAPKKRFRLGYFDVCCLVINRMIGK